MWRRNDHRKAPEIQPRLQHHRQAGRAHGAFLHFRSVISLIHLAAGQPHPALWTDTFRQALAAIGRLRIIAEASRLSAAEQLTLLREHDVVVTGWHSTPVPAALASSPGRVRYICHLTGAVRPFVPIELIRSTVPVTNWGDAPAGELAEGTLTLLLAALKNLRAHIEEKRSGEWSSNFGGIALRGGTLRHLRVGLYGVGIIGRRFAELLRPFGARLHAYDPFVAALPEGVRRVDRLDDLFREADAVSIHAAVNASTTSSVTAGLLRLLPDGGILINTSRGIIVDQAALFQELANGRLRAGLDVLTGNDQLAADHPARSWPNLILTGHAIGINHWPHPMTAPDCPLQPLHDVALDNLARFARGETLRFQVSEAQYALMT